MRPTSIRSTSGHVLTWTNEAEHAWCNLLQIADRPMLPDLKIELVGSDLRLTTNTGYSTDLETDATAQITRVVWRVLRANTDFQPMTYRSRRRGRAI